MLDRIDDGVVFILDEVGIVRRAPTRDIGMEIADIPIHGPDPIDIGEKRCAHGSALLSCFQGNRTAGGPISLKIL